MPDVFPGDLVSEVRDLRKRVEDLEAALAQRGPLTTASKGWLLTDMSIPLVSAGTCHIGCNGGDFFAATTTGLKRMFSQGSAVITPTVNLSNAPASYDQTWAQNHVASTSAIFQSYANGLLPSLRVAGHIAT